MAFADTFLPEFEQEMKTTRSLLERVPFDKAAWKPHEKSTALGALASHIANLAGFAPRIVGKTEIDLAGGGTPRAPQVYSSTSELLTTFDANLSAAREAIAGLREDDIGTPWTLRMGGHVIFTLPRSAVMRTFMLSHIIHHRGQLSVYLRLNDVPLPPMYGPTADS